MNSIIKSNIEILTQLADILKTLPIDKMCSPSDSSSSSLGKHIRHILDHYLALQDGYDVNHINYNERNRNSNIESDRQAALNLTSSIINWLRNSPLIDKPLLIHTEISTSSIKNINVNSNLKRELCYLLNHSIHHMAFISLLAKFQNITLAPNIGIAPSTASHLRSHQSNI